MTRRQDHTHAGVHYATMPTQHPGGINNRSGPGSRVVYHSHADGRTPHGHEPTDRHGAYDAPTTQDSRGYSPGYGIRTVGMSGGHSSRG